MTQTLHFIDYTIDNNLFRAYRDSNGRLVFVLDYFTNEIKPNVLLVINPDGDRKWDDIISNDYNIDLEDIRPKKDNKYQKLDIEYSGLNIYDELFATYNAQEDTSDVLAQLNAFRKNAARKAAIERLNAAETTSANARETIVRTNDTITQLQSRQKELRGKLSELRRNIGKEPTKQSAAKILRTESQLDTTNDKLARANKRIQNAKHRLSAAMDEIELAQKILNLTQNDDTIGDVHLPSFAQPTQIQTVPNTSNALTRYTPDDEETETFEPKVTDMADEEVKPLFDQDPNILDEELAFKPIDFSIPENLTVSEPENQPISQSQPESDSILEPIPTPELERPLSFQPAFTSDMDNIDNHSLPKPATDTMLENLTPISTPAEPIFSETPDLPSETDMEQYSMPFTTNEPAPVLASQTNDFSAPTPQYGYPMPDTSERPASPYTGENTRPVPPMSNQTNVQVAQQSKPTFLYYVLLILLIALSIFTLWIYQQQTNTGTPELGTPQPQVEETISETTEPTVVEPVESTVTVEEAATTIDETPVEPTVPTNDKPSVIDGPVAEPVTEPKPEIPTEEEILAKKPAYNVSSDDKMFVAAEEYVSEEPAKPAIEPVVESVVIEEKPTIEIAEPVIVPVSEPEPIAQPVTTTPVIKPEPIVQIAESEPIVQPVTTTPVIKPEPIVQIAEPKPIATQQNAQPAPQMVTSEVYTTTSVATPAETTSVEYTTTEVINTCADGNRPDMYGCCNGEEFVDFGNNTQLCCIIGSDECFEPLID